jgi:hypothetical protein
MSIAVWPLGFCVGGALAWSLSSNPKIAEMGKIAFCCGLFWLVYVLSGKTVRFM